MSNPNFVSLDADIQVDLIVSLAIDVGRNYKRYKKALKRSIEVGVCLSGIRCDNHTIVRTNLTKATVAYNESVERLKRLASML